MKELDLYIEGINGLIYRIFRYTLYLYSHGLYRLRYVELNNNNGTCTRIIQRYSYVVIQHIIKIFMVDKNQYFSFSSEEFLKYKVMLLKHDITIHT